MSADLFRGKILAPLLACFILAPGRTARAQDGSSGAARGTGRDAITLGYVLPDSSDARQLAFDRGARLGLAEAAHAAALLRRELVVAELDAASIASGWPDEPTASASAPRPIQNDELNVLITAALTDSLATKLAAWAARPGHAVVASVASLRSICALPVFRTGPDSATREAVLRAAHPSLIAASPAGPAPTRSATYIELWHHDLVRFGARQLSDRYAQRYGALMTSAAWEGWMAVKVAWESALRAPGGNIAAALAHGAFDGHKGVALRFGARDRVLRQPLVVVATEAAPGGSAGVVSDTAGSTSTLREIPWPTDDRGGASDSVGTAATGCHSSPR